MNGFGNIPTLPPMSPDAITNMGNNLPPWLDRGRWDNIVMGNMMMQAYSRPKKPTEKHEKKLIRILQEGYDESLKIIKAKKENWQRYGDLYENILPPKRLQLESNLLIPKPHYIVENITPRIMTAIYGAADWITVTNPRLPDALLRDLGQGLIWILEKKVKAYMSLLELFKASPRDGTAIAKVYLQGKWPVIDYCKLDSFLPDPLANKPGDIDSMRYCFHTFRRDLRQLKAFRVNGVPQYFNLEGLEKEAEEAKITELKMEGVDSETIKDIEANPIFDIAEYHGELPDEKGTWREYVATMIIKKDPNAGDMKIHKLIRFDKSRFIAYQDGQYKPLKPFICSIYSPIPGRFYGIGAIEAIEPLVAEQSDMHNLFIDNYKRYLNGIVQVLNTSGLTARDIVFGPDQIWWVDSHDDVQIQEVQMPNVGATFNLHKLLDTEIDKTSGVPGGFTGTPPTKRETKGEVFAMLQEASARFQLFLQMADRLTLRPLMERVMFLLKNSVVGVESLSLPAEGGGMINLFPEHFHYDLDFQFAATTIEGEQSKYEKRQILPQIIQALASLPPSMGYTVDMAGLMEEMVDLFNIKKQVIIREPMIPLKMLPPQMQQMVVQMMQQMAQGGQGGEQGAGQGPA